MNKEEVLRYIEDLKKTGVKKVKIKNGDFELSVKLNKTSVKKSPSNKVTKDDNNDLKTQFLENKITSENKLVENTENFLEQPKFKTIKSPMVGIFYKRPSPDKQPYINVGEDITHGKIICLIEAMRLFHEIESDVKGKVVKILVDDYAKVEFDQPLFLIEQ